MRDKSEPGKQDPAPALLRGSRNSTAGCAVPADAVSADLSANGDFEILKRAYAEGIASGAPRELNAEETLAAYTVRFGYGVSQRCAPTVEAPHRAALNAALARGLADAEAGRTSDLDDAMAKLIQALGLPGEIRKA